MEAVVGAMTARELSYDEWVSARVPALIRFAYLVTGSQHAAEDAVQTALTSAYERWPRIQRADDPDAYVRRMVVNAHVSWWRRFGRRESAVPEIRSLSVAPDPATRAAEDDAVWRACAGLGRTQRAAIVLRFFEDLEYAEIARILGCAEATARSHVHRALAVMRTELEREEDSDA